MISVRAAAHVWDARRAAERIIRFTQGRSYTEYLEDDLLHPAVERRFKVLGEAFVNLRRLDPALASGIADLTQVIASRNVFVHDDTAINHARLWETIGEEVPNLLVRLTRLMDEEGPPLAGTT